LQHIEENPPTDCG